MHPTAAAANLFRVVHEHARTAAEAEGEGGEGAFNFATAFKDNRMKCIGKNGEKHRQTNITISVSQLENRHLLMIINHRLNILLLRTQCSRLRLKTISHTNSTEGNDNFLT